MAWCGEHLYIQSSFVISLVACVRGTVLVYKFKVYSQALSG